MLLRLKCVVLATLELSESEVKVYELVRVDDAADEW